MELEREEEYDVMKNEIKLPARNDGRCSLALHSATASMFGLRLPKKGDSPGRTRPHETRSRRDCWKFSPDTVGALVGVTVLFEASVELHD